MSTELLKDMKIKNKNIQKLNNDKLKLMWDLTKIYDNITVLTYKLFGSVILSAALFISYFTGASITTIPIIIDFLLIGANLGLFSYSITNIKKIYDTIKKKNELKEKIDNVENELKNEILILKSLENKKNKEYNKRRENKKYADNSLKKDIKKLELEELNKYKDIVNELNSIGRNNKEKIKTKTLKKNNN